MNSTIRFSAEHQVEADLFEFGLGEKGLYCTSIAPLPEPAVLESTLQGMGGLCQFRYLLPKTAVIFRNGDPPESVLSFVGTI